MPVSLDERDDRLVLHDGPHVLGTFRWQRNRLHDQPGVLRLNIDGFTTIPADELPTLVDQAVQALLDRMRRHGVLVLRTVLDHGHPLVPLLLDRGFIETRRTLLPVLRLDQAHDQSLEPSLAEDESGTETVSLRDALQRHSETALTELYWTIYRHSARHDPATAERLTPSERLELTLGDPQLDHDASVVAERADHPVGLCTVYRTDDPTDYELGILGVDVPDNISSRRLTQQMLAAAVHNLRHRNATRLQAEIDSDDPHTLYALAEWPFQHHAKAVTLTLILHWRWYPS